MKLLLFSNFCFDRVFENSKLNWHIAFAFLCIGTICLWKKTYKINGEQAIHLNSRPQAKDARPSTKSKNAGSCVTCKRYIQDRPNRFCSISCKVIYVISISFKVFPLCIVTLLVMHCLSSFYINSWQKYTKRSDEKVIKMFFDYTVYKLFYRNNLEISKES